MNAQDILKELNSGKTTVHELLAKDNEQSGISEILSRLFHLETKPAEQIISDNFEQIIYRCNDNSLLTILMDLFAEHTTRNIISSKFDIILKRLSEVDNKSVTNPINHFLKLLADTPQGIEIIKNNFKSIIRNINKSDLFQIAQTTKGISQEIDDLLEKQLEENHLEVAKSLLNTYKIDMGEDKDKLLQDYANTLSTMIQELLISENSSWLEINKNSNSPYSDVYEIKNKELRIGELKQTYHIPNHTRILPPLTRINLIDNDGNEFACIEIKDKVESIKKDDADMEKLYKLYAELREDGIIWTNITWDNIGIAPEVNVPSLNGENIDVVPSSIGFSDNQKGKPLKAGDWVITNTDYIYDENCTEVIWKTPLAQHFEERWQQEQQKKIAEKYKTQNNVTQNNVTHDVDRNET